jgi:hypothetical protein
MTAYPKLVMRSETSHFADLSSLDTNSTSLGQGQVT